jgi:hypothetical protein
VPSFQPKLQGEAGGALSQIQQIGADAMQQVSEHEQQGLQSIRRPIELQ